jgi:sugar phosphate isomerase/epimerase/glycosyltransferase involved in cell wall biosynthesis
MIKKTRSIENKEMPAENLVMYDNPQRQFVDLYSRFGIWEDVDSDEFGFGNAELSSQRKGKHFMEPLLGIGLHYKGKLLFVEPGQLTERTITFYPGGYVQKGSIYPIGLNITAVFSQRDVVAVKVEITNTADDEISSAVFLKGRTIKDNQNKNIIFDEMKNLICISLTSLPTAPEYPLREEPDFEIFTGIRPSFKISKIDIKREDETDFRLGFEAIGEDFIVPANDKRVFSIILSASSDNCELATKRALSVVDIGTAILEAKRRWEKQLASISIEKIEEKYRETFYRAMITLIKNTIVGQSEQNYGTLLGPYRGTFPARSSYEAFWIWDSAFQAIAFKEWDTGLAKDNIRVVLHNQDKTNGGLKFLHPDSMIASAQPPLLSWAAWQIYQKDKDLDFLSEVYSKLSNWNEWWFTYQAKDRNSLAEWGSNLESGWDNSPRWDNRNPESLNLISPDLNTFLVLDMRILALMAKSLGYDGEAEVWNARAEVLVQRIVEELYDEGDNLFYDVDSRDRSPLKVLTLSCFLPLWVGVPLSGEKAKEMIEKYLLSEKYFFGEVPFPVVAYSDKKYNPANSWRGPTWLNIAYFMINILYKYGYSKEAELARERILNLVSRYNYISEYYNSKTGEPSGASAFSFSCAITMLMILKDFGFDPPPSSLEKIQGKPKIAIIHYSFFETAAGVNRVIKDQVELLKEYGFSIQVIIGQTDVSSTLGVKVTHVPQINVLPEMVYEFDRYKGEIYHRLKDELRDKDIIIIHNILTMDFNMPLIKALEQIIEEEKDKKKFIAWTHDINYFTPIRGVKYIVVSKYMQKYLAESFNWAPQMIPVMQNGLYMKRLIGLTPEIERIFRGRKLLEQDYVMLYPTKVGVAKNIEMAIKIVAELNRKGKKAKLIVTGLLNDQDREQMAYFHKLKQLTEDQGVSGKIIFLSDQWIKGKRLEVTDEMMRNLYTLSDFLLFTSQHEGFGLPPIEAAAFGLPIVVSDIEPVRSLLTDADMLLIDPYAHSEAEIEKISQEIIDYIDNKSVVRMKKEARTRYDLQRIYEGIVFPLIGVIKPAVGLQSSIHHRKIFIEEQFKESIDNGFEVFEIFFDYKSDRRISFLPRHIFQPTREWLRKTAKEMGVALQVYAPLADVLTPERIEQIEDTLEFAHDVNAKTVIIMLGKPGQEFAEVIKSVLMKARRYGIHIAIENGFYLCEGKERIHTTEDLNNTLFYLRNYNDVVAVSFNIGYANLVENPVAYLNKIEGKIINVHISDNKGDIDSRLRIGQGNIPIKEIIQTLKQKDYQGSLIIEYWYDDIIRDKAVIEDFLLS